MRLKRYEGKSLSYLINRAKRLDESVDSSKASIRIEHPVRGNGRVVDVNGKRALVEWIDPKGNRYSVLSPKVASLCKIVDAKEKVIHEGRGTVKARTLADLVRKAPRLDESNRSVDGILIEHPERGRGRVIDINRKRALVEWVDGRKSRYSSLDLNDAEECRVVGLREGFGERNVRSDRHMGGVDLPPPDEDFNETAEEVAAIDEEPLYVPDPTDVFSPEFPGTARMIADEIREEIERMRRELGECGCGCGDEGEDGDEENTDELLLDDHPINESIDFVRNSRYLRLV